VSSRLKNFWLILSALLFSVSSLPAQRLSPGFDALKAETIGSDLALPEPASGRLENSPLISVRAERLRAEQLYSDGVYKPAPLRMSDDDNGRLIMLQGFHWYADSYWIHPPGGWWGVVADKAAEAGKAGFGLIWLPPVSRGSYYPTEWYNLDSQWGTRDGLLKAVRALHSSGIKVVADIILNHRNGSKDWADFTDPDWPTDVVVRDDEWTGSPKSLYADEGMGDGGCRDIDHRSPLVRRDAKIFLRWLRETIGFDGWRYDMVKGYPAHYVGMYNKDSSPAFSVGEYYDTNRQLLADWADGTDNSPGKPNASTVFDFTTRYSIVGAVESGRYGPLNDNGRAAGFIGWWSAKSVTFVENHDTSPRDPNFLPNASAEYKNQRLIGYAYILTHPGIPCVFWPHFFDWGQDYRSRLQALMDIRKAAGITSTSRLSIMAASDELYAAIVEGESKRVAVRLGRSLNWDPGPGWTLAAGGERYAVWTQALH